MNKLSTRELVQLAWDNKVYSQGDTRRMHLHIMGLRSKAARPNRYDDLLCLLYTDLKGDFCTKQYTATTLPGVPYLRKPMNRKGTAVMVPGRYENAYAIGLHKGRYTALVQVRPVSVWRDNDRDDVAEKTKYVDTGLFGINIHKASLLSGFIGVDSAGCQVIKDSAEYDEFIELCLTHRSHWGNKFTYTLVEI